MAALGQLDAVSDLDRRALGPDLPGRLVALGLGKALDNAIPCGTTADARGVSRNASKCDIGAFEAP